MSEGNWAPLTVPDKLEIVDSLPKYAQREDHATRAQSARARDGLAIYRRWKIEDRDGSGLEKSERNRNFEK